jgi:hypothetical protein
MNPIYFIGPFVAVIGIVSVFFVLRHKSVQTRSMYSSRRSNLERKVRAARTRTLGPEKHVEKEPAAHGGHGAPGGPAKLTYEPSAFEGPPVAPPPAPMAAPNQTWDVGPTVPPPTMATAAPAPAPPYTPEPPPPPPPPEPVWTPSPPEPVAKPLPAAPVEVPAGAGASWSIVGGESKDVPISETDGKKKKKGKRDAETSAWQLASGEAPGDESEDQATGPNTAMAIAQWAAIALGLLAVLIGIMLMIATSNSA